MVHLDAGHKLTREFNALYDALAGKRPAKAKAPARRKAKAAA